MKFFKYSAAGNDFILFDTKGHEFDYGDREKWSKLCQRGTGIGADGILFVEHNPYRMVYLNADGGEAEMCGNGLRAVVSYLKKSVADLSFPLMIQTFKNEYIANLENENIWIQMNDITRKDAISVHDLYPYASNSLFIDTGVPHSVFQVESVDALDFISVAKKVRNDERFSAGTNVDFFEELEPGKIRMRVFERGVEDETLSSGTGVTAVALAYQHFCGWIKPIQVVTKGGEFLFKIENDEPWLSGPVELVYEGIL